MIFVKQYGAQRSGTNYLFYLLHRNFKGVKPLGNVLGSKHSPPVDYKRWLAKNPHWRKKHNIKGLDTSLSDLFFTISIRNPYSWVLGYMAYQKRLHKGMKERDPVKFAAICKKYSSFYKEWKHLYEARLGRVVIVKFEDILRNFKAVLTELERAFQLQRRGDDFGDVVNIIASGGKVTAKRYTKRKYYLQEKYMVEFSPELKKVVDESIDWNVWNWYGYERKH